jgi:hypothetical protein
VRNRFDAQPCQFSVDICYFSTALHPYLGTPSYQIDGISLPIIFIAECGFRDTFVPLSGTDTAPI